MLTSNGTDPHAQLTLYVHNRHVELSVKMLSLFPAENVKGDMLQPFRTDILDYLKALKPRYGYSLSQGYCTADDVIAM